MKKYIKKDSDIPTFYVSLGKEVSPPDDFKEITQEDINKIQDGIKSNNKGSIVKGKWVAKKNV